MLLLYELRVARAGIAWLGNEPLIIYRKKRIRLRLPPLKFFLSRPCLPRVERQWKSDPDDELCFSGQVLFLINALPPASHTSCITRATQSHISNRFFFSPSLPLYPLCFFYFNFKVPFSTSVICHIILGRCLITDGRWDAVGALACWELFLSKTPWQNGLHAFLHSRSICDLSGLFEGFFKGGTIITISFLCFSAVSSAQVEWTYYAHHILKRSHSSQANETDSTLHLLSTIVTTCMKKYIIVRDIHGFRTSLLVRNSRYLLYLHDMLQTSTSNKQIQNIKMQQAKAKTQVKTTFFSSDRKC